jgi:hypothetical protein
MTWYHGLGGGDSHVFGDLTRMLPVSRAARDRIVHWASGLGSCGIKATPSCRSKGARTEGGRNSQGEGDTACPDLESRCV